jgi:hypothetical protein
MPLIMENTANDITLGEICNTFRVAWGNAKRMAEGF